MRQSTMWIVLLSAFATLIFFLVNEGHITYEKSYYDEYQETQARLSECQEMKTPNCAPCQCPMSPIGVIFGILGVIMYVIGWLHLNDIDLLKNFRKKKAKKKK